MNAAVTISGPALPAIELMLSSACARAGVLGVKANIAIVDGGGNLAGFIRMPGAFLSSADLAIDKAYTAASFSMSTRGFGILLAGSSRAVREGLLRRPRLTEVAGGVALELDGQAAGGLGVSGGSEEQDEDIAAYAAAAMTPGRG